MLDWLWTCSGLVKAAGLGHGLEHAPLLQGCFAFDSLHTLTRCLDGEGSIIVRASAQLALG